MAISMPAGIVTLLLASFVAPFGSIDLGSLAFYGAIDLIGVTHAVIITSAWPGVSFVVGMLIFRERGSLAKAAGIVLMMASVVLAVEPGKQRDRIEEGRPSRNASHDRPGLPPSAAIV